MKLLEKITSQRSKSINFKYTYSTLMNSQLNQCKNKLLLMLIASLSFSNIVSADCDHVGAYIVNLSQDAFDKLNPEICTSRPLHSSIRDCIAEQIRESLPDDCETKFDIYVPGTNAEQGAWKQFNRMFKTDTNRAHLVLAYNDTTINFFDGALYDQGVIDARLSLILLLDALNQNFNVDQIRVFGHSKGSHSVALVSDDSSYDNVEFYAFAQPGRTDIDIDDRADIKAGKLGRPGYIEKLSGNLVGITWKNDEVQYYIGGNDGYALPEIWSFPGYIWQENNGVGVINTFGYLHIDHHNNYGGLYTDGKSGNDWREGEGTVADAHPYCATGDKSEVKTSTECKKQDIKKSPYFWGSPECVAEAYRMMKKGGTGDRYKIGYSGPRQPGSCKESEHLTRVRYDLDYSFDLPDKNCVYTLRFGFEDIGTGKERDSFEVVGTTDNQLTDLSDSGYIFVPIHMQLKVRAKLTERNHSFTDNNCNSPAQSEAWIETLLLTFDHPGTSESNKEVTIIGFDEGRGAINNLHMYDNVAWEHPNLSSDDLRIYYEPLKNSIKIQNKIGNWSTDGDVGNFRKRVHLLD